MEKWGKLLIQYINYDRVRKHSKKLVIVGIVLFLYMVFVRFIEILKPIWISERTMQFLEIDILEILSGIISLAIGIVILTLLISLLVLFLQLKEPFMRKILFINGCPMWVCYKFDSTMNDSDEIVRNLLEKVASEYKKKRILLLEKSPQCYIVYGAANKTSIDTRGKRNDAQLLFHNPA